MKLDLLRTRVARRVLLLFLLCAILPVGLLATYGYRYLADTLETRARGELRTTAKGAGMMLLDRLGSLADMLVQRGALPLDQSHSDETVLTPHGLVAGPRFRALTLRTSSSQLRAIAGPLLQVPELTAAQRTQLSNGGVALVTARGPAGTAVLIVASAEHGRGELWGEIDPETVWSGPAGIALVPPGMGLCLRVVDGPELNCPDPAVETALEEPDDGNARTVGVGTDAKLLGVWTMFLGRGYAAPSWRLGLSVPVSVVQAPLTRLRDQFLLGLSLLIIVVFFVTHVQLRRQMQPLEALTAGTERVRSGDFESRVDVQSKDEFESLAHSFNNMTSELGRQFTLREALQQVHRAALGSRDPKAVLDALFRARTGLFGGAGLTVALARGDDPFWWWVADESTHLHGAPPRDVSPSPRDLDELRANADGFIVRRGERGRSYFEPPGEVLLREVAVVPIMRNGQVTGALVRPSAAEEEGSSAGTTKLRDHLEQVTVALANTQLLDQLDGLTWGALTALARAIDAASPWTAGHSERVTQGAVEIGRRLGFGEAELDELHRGGLLHDIGKVGVPAHILDKPGALDAEEMKAIRAHPTIGARILAPIAAFRSVLPLVLHHHEALDGSGYPHGLAGDQIPLAVRVLTVADVFDALVSERPYRAAWTYDRAIALLREGAGTKFEPRAVEALATAVAEGWRSKADGSLLTEQLGGRRRSGGRAVAPSTLTIWPAPESAPPLPRSTLLNQPTESGANRPA